jgi:RNA polymerase sigma factor (sigma-70 family)
MLKWPVDAPESHEDLFVRRYEHLLHRALRLTGQDRQRAEDLVHEAFVQFVLGRPDLSLILDLDAYLHGMLRNLQLSHARRSARGPVAWLSAIDYDSVEIGLRDLDVGRRLQIRDELVAILRYACARKRTSKSGTVLLFRFFHGYYPDEIAKVLGGPVRAVDDWLRLARREARQALSATGASDEERVDVTLHSSQSTTDWVVALRAAIFAAGDGECDPGRLADVYRSGAAGTVPTLLLAHTVSCRGCLERTNRLLGLPPLSDRYPIDSLGPGGRTPGRGGGGGGNGASAADRGARASVRRLRDVLEHRPKELRIVANGFHVGSQSIAGPRVEQSLTVNVPEPLAFVEVFSEQGVRLAMLAVEPLPAGDVEQARSTRFGADRSLDVTVSFGGSWPTIRTTYADAAYTPPDAVADSIEPRADESNVQPFPRFSERSSSLRDRVRAATRWLSGRRGWQLAATCAATAVLAAFMVHNARRASLGQVTGDALLARAVSVEQAADATSPLVHRTVTIERARAGATPAASYRLETWRDTGARRAARRLFDASNRLVSAEWTDPDGGAIVFDRTATPRIRRFAPGDARRAGSSQDWAAASAADLVETAVAVGTPIVTDSEDAYIVGFEFRGRVDPGWRAAARLTIRKADSHLVEEVLTVRRAAAVTQYRIVEVGFRRLEQRAAPDGVFAVDPGLDAEPSGRSPEPLAAATPMPSMAAAVLLELRAVQTLHDAGACLGEQVAVSRTPAGVVRIDGVVDNDERRRTLLAAFDVLRGEPGFQLRITSASTTRGWRRNEPTAIRHVDVDGSRMAAHADLVRFFEATAAPGANVEETVRAFAEGTLERSRRALLHAWAIKHLTDEFSPAALRAMGPGPYAQWLALMTEHATAYRDEMEAIRRDAGPAFQRADAQVPLPASVDRAELWSASARLLSLATAIDADVRAALATSDGATTSALQSDAFWERLVRAISLAHAVGHAF